MRRHEFGKAVDYDRGVCRELFPILGITRRPVFRPGQPLVETIQIASAKADAELPDLYADHDANLTSSPTSRTTCTSGGRGPPRTGSRRRTMSEFMDDCLDSGPLGRVELYRQCRLTRWTPEGKQTRMSWLPLEFSEPGMCVRLKDKGVWTDGWIIDSGPPGPIQDKKAIDKTRRTRLESITPRRRGDPR